MRKIRAVRFCQCFVSTQSHAFKVISEIRKLIDKYTDTVHSIFIAKRKKADEYMHSVFQH